MLAVVSRAEQDVEEVRVDELDAGSENRAEAVARGRALLARALPSGEDIADRLIARLVAERAN